MPDLSAVDTTPKKRRSARMVTSLCKQCGCSFQARAVDVNRGKATLCSRKCLFLWKSKVSERATAKVELIEIEGAACASVEIATAYDKPIIIDASDLDWFLDFPGGWALSTAGDGFYVQANRGHKKLHTYLLDVPDGKYVDHRNRVTLDCRRGNLRPATPRQNVINRRTKKVCSSSFVGIHWSKQASRWVTHLKDCRGRRWTFTHRGGEEFSALVRDGVVAWMYGSFAILNFPDRLSEASAVAAPVIARFAAKGAIPDAE